MLKTNQSQQWKHVSIVDVRVRGINNWYVPDSDRLPMPIVYVGVGKLVRAYRQKLKLSQAALAVRIGHTRTSVTNIEAGRQRIPLDLLFTFANALGISVTELIPRTIGELSPEIELRIADQYDDSQIRAIRRLVKGRGGERE